MPGACAGPVLQLMKGAFEVGIEMLDRGRHVAGKDLAGVMEDAAERDPARVQVAVEPGIANHGQGMGDHRHVQGVLLDVLRHRVAHQPPAADVTHAGKEGEEVVLFGCTLVFHGLSLFHYLPRSV